MEGGDLGLSADRRVIVVLEGVLCTPAIEREGALAKLSLGIAGRIVVRDGSQWAWSVPALKSFNRYVYNNIPMDVVTFLGIDVAEEATKWLSTYGVDIVVNPVDYPVFCESLSWRLNDVSLILDNSPERGSDYGQLGYIVGPDGRF